MYHTRMWLLIPVLITLVKVAMASPPLGLPPVPIPANNPQTPEKIQLGSKLYHDIRLSADGKVSCATCHEQSKGFTDHLAVSKGFKGLTGTRNAPTVINSAYMKSMFWDGREPDLEEQSKQPFINPVEGGLANHADLLKIIKGLKDYANDFKQVFDTKLKDINIDQVAQAIASFERTVIAGNSPFDRYYYSGQEDALSDAQKRGLDLFINKGRCVSCHVIEQTQALFTDSRFHNIGVGFKTIQGKESETAASFLRDKRSGASVDVSVLTRKNISELGRFAVTENITEVGAFKTPTLRNITVTQPYMHDGSLATLEDVVEFYNNGGRLKDTDPISGFLSGGMRPLDLTAKEKQDLVAFLNALTSPEFATQAAAK